MTAGRVTTGGYSAVIHAGTGKCRRACVTGGAILSPDIGVNLIGRCVGRRNTTRDMTALTRGCTNRIVIHDYTGPTRITVARLTTDQAGVVWRAEFIRRMATTGGTARDNKGMIHLRPDKRRG